MHFDFETRDLLNGLQSCAPGFDTRDLLNGFQSCAPDFDTQIRWLPVTRSRFVNPQDWTLNGRGTRTPGHGRYVNRTQTGQLRHSTQTRWLPLTCATRRAACHVGRSFHCFCASLKIAIAHMQPWANHDAPPARLAHTGQSARPRCACSKPRAATDMEECAFAGACIHPVSRTFGHVCQLQCTRPPSSPHACLLQKSCHVLRVRERAAGKRVWRAN